MWKYRSQTTISVIGLAVGFTCFALGALWIRYEMTFDSFHKNAERMYVVYMPSTFSNSGYSKGSAYKLSSYLKETFPDIEEACPVSPAPIMDKITVEGREVPAMRVTADSSFLKMFDVKILEGSNEFLVPGSNKLAITRKKARQLYGNENPIGKPVDFGDHGIAARILNLGKIEYTICAVVTELPNRSNFAFDIISSFSETTMSMQSMGIGA
jgi:hypothetical protein